ncbi:MAG: PilZ domain-containing protein [Candidatus Angelobacter sp.]
MKEAKIPVAGSGPADTRSSVRFPLRLPITVRTADAHEYFAETADISAGGVLFHTVSALDVGTVIRFRIVLPASVLGTDTDVQVNCTGRVVRSSLDEKGKKAVAAVIDEYCFERIFASSLATSC